VMRGEGLAAGLIRERTLYPADLARATRIWRINSLRGWQEVEKSALLAFAGSHEGREGGVVTP